MSKEACNMPEHMCHQRCLWARCSVHYNLAPWWRLGTLFLFSVLLVACAGPAEGLLDVPCNVLTGNGLADLMLETKTPQQWSDLITSAYPVTPSVASTIQVVDDDEQHISLYGWDVELTHFDMRVRDGTLTSIRILFQDNSARPALGRVVDCLGEPDYYSITYGGASDARRPSFSMDFYYTNQGVHFSSFVTAPRLNNTGELSRLEQPAKATTPVTFIDWVAPGDVREIDWKISYPDGSGVTKKKETFWEQNAAYYDIVQPWPGSIEQLQVTWADPSRLPPAQAESSLATPTPHE